MADEHRPGDVVNGHVLSAFGGWQRLRFLPPNAQAPFYAGDVVNGHVFTGEQWLPYAQAGPGAALPGATGSGGRPRRRGRLAWIGLGVAGAVGLVALFTVAAMEQQPAGPEVQAQFIAEVQSAQSVRTNNGAAVNQAKVSRGQRLCEILPPQLGVEDWQGTVITVTDELGGDDAILKIELAEGISVDAHAGFFDTGIKPGTDLYDRVSALTEGQTVTFSGAFHEDDTYCIAENSIMDENGLRTPTFAFRFASVE